MKKPIIGIPAHGEMLLKSSLRLCTEVSALNLSYSNAVIRNGGIPIIVPFSEDLSVIHETLGLCDGFIMPGGSDSLDPYLYGEEPLPLNGAIDYRLDRMEYKILDYLWAHQIPTLGICRGHQIMNVYAGGSIYQHAPTMYEKEQLEHLQGSPRHNPTHAIELVDGCRLAGLLGKTRLFVNSFHHQALKKIGKGFTVTACSSDGIVEAIEHENGIWTGVQWHPEDLLNTVPEMNEIFKKLIADAAKFAESK